MSSSLLSHVSSSHLSRLSYFSFVWADTGVCPYGWVCLLCKAAASSIAEMAEKNVGSISQFMWDTAVLRIGQLASEMNVSMEGQSVGGSNGNADELTNWDGTKKKGLSR